MKGIKKILAVMAAVMMMIGLTATNAHAAPSDTTLSVSGVAGHTYKYYQLFVGDLATDGTTLSNVKWGNDAASSVAYKTKDTDGNFTVDATATVAKGEAVPQAVLDYVASLSGKTASDNAQATADIIGAWVTGEGTAIPANGATVKTGYYVIKDSITDNAAAGQSTVSTTIVEIVGPTIVTPKASTVTSEKHVDDQNDSDSTDHSELMDSADYDIGDNVPYTLTFTLPADYASYTTYYVQFVDDMSAGLNYNGDAKIYYGASDTVGADITFTADSTATSAYTDGTVYKATITDLKTTKPGLADGTVITIKYTAKLNANAVIGSAGNPNQYQVEYSRNPNNGGDGDKGTTPWDKNIVFTYKTVFNKVMPSSTGSAGETEPLTGADFKLEKKVGSDWVDVTKLHGEAAGTINPEKTGDTSGSTFTFSGLDAGDYKLTETTTPNGYNTIAPIEFTITATHDLVSDNPALTALTGTDGAGFVMTPDAAAGSLTAPILNQAGSTLPETGGIGTTIFYAIGSILVVGAGVLLISKKRMFN